MKNFIGCLLITLLLFGANAQTKKGANSEQQSSSDHITVNWYKIDNSITGKYTGDQYHFVCNTRNRFLIYNKHNSTTKNDEEWITKLSDDFTPVFDKKLNLPSSPEGDLDLYSVISAKNIVYLVLRHSDKEGYTSSLYLCKVSANGEINSNVVPVDKMIYNPNVVIDVTYNTPQSLIQSNNNLWVDDSRPIIPNPSLEYIINYRSLINTAYRATISPDSSKLLFYHYIAPDKKDKEATQRFSCTVVDTGLKQLWSKTIKVPYTIKQYTANDLKVDNEGNVYLIGTQKLEGAEKTDIAKYDHRLIAYYWKDSQAKEYTLALDKKIISTLNFTFDKNNNIIICGFFSNKNDYNTNGYFYTTIDNATKTLAPPITNDLTAVFNTKTGYKAMNGEFEPTDNYGELKDFIVKDIYENHNGTITLIAEQKQRKDVGGNSTMETATAFLTNDIVVLNLKKDGSLNWSTVIPKEQEMEGQWLTQLSYIFLHDDEDNLCFIYNDDPKNAGVNKKTLYTYKEQYQGSLMTATVTADGNLTRKALAQPEENTNNYVLHVNECTGLGNNNYAIFAYHLTQFKGLLVEAGIVKIK